MYKCARSHHNATVSFHMVCLFFVYIAQVRQDLDRIVKTQKTSKDLRRNAKKKS